MRFANTFAIAVSMLVVGCNSGSSSQPPPPLPPDRHVFLDGFETGTDVWNETQGITRVASNDGTLGIPAAAGGFYAEVESQPDGYDTGFGDAGYSYYGG